MRPSRLRFRGRPSIRRRGSNLRAPSGRAPGPRRRDGSRGTAWSSTTALCADDTADGAAHDASVEHESLVAEVPELVLEFFECIVFVARVAVFHLSPASEPRT